MKQRRLFSTILLFPVIALFAASAALAQSGNPARAELKTSATSVHSGFAGVRADDDSLKSKAELEAEIQQLQSEIAGLQSKLEIAENDEEKNQIILEISAKEDRVIELRNLLAGTAPKEDEWDFEGFGKDDDTWEDDEDTPKSEFEEWADIESEFFQKYPAVFSWPFPMETGFTNSFVRYNRVEGFYLGLAHNKRLNWHSKKQIVTTFSIGYGFASMKGRYSAGLYFPFYFDNQILEIGGEGHHVTDSKDQWMMDIDENSVMAFFGKEDFMDYFQRSGYSVGASWYYRTTSEQTIRFSARYLHDTYREMGKETNWSLFGGDKNFRENPIRNNPLMTSGLFGSGIHGNINSLVFGLGWSTTASDLRDQGWNLLATFEAGGAGMKGNYEFNQFIFDARRYQTLGEHVNVNARFRLGGSDGTLPFQRTFDMGGIGTLPGYRFKLLSGTHMGLLNTELIVKSSIAGAADGWFKRFMDSFNLILFYDLGTTIIPAQDPPVTDAFGNIISESEAPSLFDGFSDLSDVTWLSSAGVAVGARDGSYRIGVAWPLTGEVKDAMLVVRLSAPF